MSYIGSTPTTQNFIAGTDSFNGTGSQTNFTLSRLVNSVNDIQVVVNNVVQYPPNYSVSGNTLTISPAPSAGTNNVYVRYLSTTLQSIAPSQGVAIQFGTGSASLPSISFIGDSNTGIYSPAADTIAFVEGGTEAVRIDSSGNVGIGTSSIPGKFRVSGADGTAIGVINGASYAVRFGSAAGIGAYVEGVDIGGVSSYQPLIVGGSTLTLATGGAAQAAITAAGLFQFNSGYGSVATAYGCRAWVNFNGTGTVAIRASGNVTSITDNGVGDYTVNFTNAMPDANYSYSVAASNAASLGNLFTGSTLNVATSSASRVAPTTSAARFIVYAGSSFALTDLEFINVSFFR